MIFIAFNSTPGQFVVVAFVDFNDDDLFVLSASLATTRTAERSVYSVSSCFVPMILTGRLGGSEDCIISCDSHVKVIK